MASQMRQFAAACLALGLCAAPAYAQDKPAPEAKSPAAHQAAPPPAAHPSMKGAMHPQTGGAPTHSADVGKNADVNRGVNVNRDVTVNKNVNVNRDVNVNRNVTVNRNVNVNRSEHIHVVTTGARWHPGVRFAGPRVVFTDYAVYGLAAPPIGYEWVRVDDDLLLIALATGLISEAYAVDAGY